MYVRAPLKTLLKFFREKMLMNKFSSRKTCRCLKIMTKFLLITTILASSTLPFTYSALFMICSPYFIFFCFLTCQILQLNAFDEEHNDIFAELWQKSEEISTESALQNSNANFQKIEKIKKEIVVKDEPNDNNNNDFMNQFSNEKQQKIALNKTVKEENVGNRVKSEFMEFDRISDKEEFDNGKDGEDESMDSYSMADNSNLKESASKSQKGIKKIYSEVEKQEIISKFDKFKNEFKTRAKGMFYDMKSVDEKIAQKLEIAIRTIYKWKNEFGAPKKQKNHTEAEKVELLKNFYKIKKENPQLRKDKIAQMLSINIKTLNRWEMKSKGLKPGIKQIYSEVEKQEIIAEFDHLKQKFKTRAKGMSYNMTKIDEKIAQKLGVALRTIYIWKKQLGISKKQNKHNVADKVKREIIMKYENLKKKFVSFKSMREINEKIEQKLGISVRTIYNWRNALGISKELKMPCEKEEDEKWNIINKFNKMKDEYVHKNDRHLSAEDIDEKISKKLGVNRYTIYRWKRKRGIYQLKNYTDAEKVELLENFNIIKKENPQLCNDEIAQMLNVNIRNLYNWKRISKGLKPEKRKRHTEAEKAEFVKQFYKIEEENPPMYKEKIAQMLNIPLPTINLWKRQFSNKVDNVRPIDNVQRPDGSECSTSSAL